MDGGRIGLEQSKTVRQHLPGGKSALIGVIRLDIPER
jgi:hypothetical protein